MRKVDLETNGSKTCQYPEKLKKLVDDISEAEGYLKRRLKMNANKNDQHTIKSEHTFCENGDPLNIPVS